MMEILQSGQYPEYLAFCRKMGAHFMQIPNWSKVKPGWESEILVRRESGEICAGVLLLRRKIGPFCLIYAPRGPVCDLEHLEALMEDVLRYAKKRRACCLKIDPHVPAGQAEYAARLQAMGFVQIPAGAMGNTQPKFVYQIRIAHRDAQQILQSFAPKTRYNVRVAGRKGVRIWRGGSERVSEFYPLLVETGQRDGFVVRQMQYYRNLLDQMGEYAQLFLAEYEGKPIAGAIAVWFGKHAWYLYGASSKTHREAMPNYLMQYQMMLWAREKGCEIYDMRGISGDLREDNPLYGLYRFKKGFGYLGGVGYIQELLGEFELAVHPVAYACYRAALRMRKWYKQRLLKKFRQRGAAAKQ
ncbi:peptidoglycan bridge formation glycyltransferase FemA/FemB family protein [Christensenellaceae bacterium 44-20]